MNIKSREELSKKINIEIKAITGRIKLLKETSKPVKPDNAIGRLTRMEAIGSKAISDANLSSARVRLVNLERALRRVKEDSDFGLCVECGEDIVEARLMLLPESERCVGCAGR
jgi:DnaK suppressor protein